MASAPGFEPRPHWWEVSAVTTTPLSLPLRHPCCVLLGDVAQSLSYVQTDATTPKNVASILHGALHSV